MINNYGSVPFYAAAASGTNESSNSSSNPQEVELIWPALDLLESMNESDLQTSHYELQNQEIPFTDAIEFQQLQEPEQPIQETEKEIIAGSVTEQSGTLATIAKLLFSPSKPNISRILSELQRPVQEKGTIASNTINSRCAQGWKEEEEQRLAQAVKELGTRSWALIAERMGNERTKSAYQNRYAVMKAREKQLVAPIINAGEAIFGRMGELSTPTASRKRNITEVSGGVPEQPNRHENQYNDNVEWRINSEEVPAAGTIESQLPQRPIQEKETITSKAAKSRRGHPWIEGGEEEQRLAQAVKELGTRSWALVAERMGNERTKSAYESHYTAMKVREELLVAPNITEVSEGVPEQPNRHENQYNGNVEWEINNFWLLME